MKKFFLYISLLILYNFTYSQVKDPRMSRYGFEINYKPLIYYNTFISYNDGPKMYFSLDIQNDILQFKKDNEIYRAKYEITLNLKDFDEQTTLFSSSWNESVQLNNFEKTNAKKEYQTSTKMFIWNFQPGKYKLFVELNDAQTGNNYFSKRTIEIVDQKNQKIPHSKTVFLKENSSNNSNFIISSSNNIVEFGEIPYIMFEYHTANSDEVQIISELIRKIKDKTENVYKNTFTISPQKGYNYFTEEINDSLLIEGEYFLKYQISQQQNKEVLKDTFQVIWYDKPIYLYKYDLALRPMKYLLSDQEFEKAEDLSMDDLKVWFNNYWKEKDKTPDTPFNEVQNEFYIRVQQAIDKFSLRFKEGWRTDRGESLILYGEPDRIEKKHHNINAKPFEIWYYDNLNKKITFVDTSENGDFKLLSIKNIKD